ncbi:MAG: 1-acyl-sn-glycerol-3-phosphate acyltransferase [Nitrospira sp.]|nr:1-acyl-sn-glycerol-3-phosphate acyltransferase [Nitrospira sp.]
MNITEKDSYVTDSNRPRPLLSRIFLSAKHMFYPQFVWYVCIHSGRAAISFYSGAKWVKGSLAVMKSLENVGVKFEINGINNISSFDGPAVFIGNHMSALETFVLPCIIQPLKPVTFVVKKSLIDTPVFKYLMRSRNPITVGRTNPREDLKAVLEEGIKKLQAGISIIIFPQSTRSVVFKPEEFNTLGVKLALRAGVPVVPFALKTDAWGIGKRLKDFGPIDRNKKVHFTFGEPMMVKGRGTSEHETIIRFIQEKLQAWDKEESHHREHRES